MDNYTKESSQNWLPHENMWGFSIDLETFLTKKFYSDFELGSQEIIIESRTEKQSKWIKIMSKSTSTEDREVHG